MSIFYHTATVKRITRSIANATEGAPVLTTVYSALPCLAEGLSAWRQSTAFAELGGHTLVFSWDATAGDLQDGDEVTLAHKPGKTYYLQLSVDDTHRPAGMTSIPSYQTGVLTQEQIVRS